MTYDSIESSTAEGRPLYLYQFTQDAQVWRFTSRAAAWVSPAGAVAGSSEALTWEAAALSHSRVVQTGDVARGTLDLTFPISHPFARRFLGPRGRALTGLTIFRGHEQLPGETVAHWKGRVLGASVEGQTIVLKCDSQLTALKRAGVRAKYQKLCRHPLYGRGCGLDIEAFFLTGAATATAGSVVTVPLAAQEADGWYRGGVLRHAGALGFITGHAGEVIVLARTLPGIAAVLEADATLTADIAADAAVTTLPIASTDGLANVPVGSFAAIGAELMRITAIGDTELTVARATQGSPVSAHLAGAPIAFRPGVDLARGCDLRRETCETKFANLPHFGGFPDIPGRNPFGGSSIV
ncbi:MAG: phage BR0599 family protein [Nioella sp.]